MYVYGALAYVGGSSAPNIYGHPVARTEFSRNPCEIKVCLLGTELKLYLIITNIFIKGIYYLTFLWTQKLLEIYTLKNSQRPLRTKMGRKCKV